MKKDQKEKMSEMFKLSPPNPLFSQTLKNEKWCANVEYDKDEIINLLLFKSIKIWARKVYFWKVPFSYTAGINVTKVNVKYWRKSFCTLCVSNSSLSVIAYFCKKKEKEKKKGEEETQKPVRGEKWWHYICLGCLTFFGYRLVGNFKKRWTKKWVS